MAKDRLDAVAVAHDEQRLRREPGVLEGHGDELVVAPRSAPVAARPLPILEVAERVGGEQPVPVEERPEGVSVRDLPGGDRALIAPRDGGHQAGTSTVGAGAGALGAGAAASAASRRAGGSRGCRGRDRNGELRSERRPEDAGLGDDRGDEVMRRHVEGRVDGRRLGRRDRQPADGGDLDPSRSSIMMAGPSGVVGSTLASGAQT